MRGTDPGQMASETASTLHVILPSELRALVAHVCIARCRSSGVSDAVCRLACRSMRCWAGTRAWRAKCPLPRQITHARACIGHRHEPQLFDAVTDGTVLAYLIGATAPGCIDEHRIIPHPATVHHMVEAPGPTLIHAARLPITTWPLRARWRWGAGLQTSARWI